MDADLKSLEEKISRLITLCANLRAEIGQLRGDLSQAQLAADGVKSKMLLASNKLEDLLTSMPNGADGVNAQSLILEP